MSTPNYDINYDDKRFTQVETEKQEALTENEKLYDGMVANSDKFYNDQIQASKDWADKQTEIQNEQTDFAIEQIEQQKGQAKQDYTKEQSGAYVDWQKQSNQYGANAEQRAANGLTNTGYSESSQVNMYVAYQNRVATAREAYARAVLNYDNAIKDARLQNNAALAEIAAEALQKQLELALQGFQYKNQLLMQKAEQKTAIDQNYYQRYLAVLDQINKENSLAENVRQFNEQMAEEKRQYDSTMSFQREQFEYQKSKDAASSSGGSGGVEGSGGSSSGGSSGGSGGSVNNTSSSGSGNQTQGPAAPKQSDISSYAGKIKTNGERARYLDECVKAGSITQDEADKIMDKYYDFADSNWSGVSGGGVNWGGGIDGNAKYKNEMGDTYTGKQIYNKLVKAGYSKSYAETYVLNLQKRFGY